jgi:hypothetical protein
VRSNAATEAEIEAARRCLKATPMQTVTIKTGSGRMPAYQSVGEFGLSQEYHLKAVASEKRAKNATDQITVQQWHELAAQWDSMANQAAKMLGDASLWSDRPQGYE